MVKDLTYLYCLKDGRLVSPEDVGSSDEDLTCFNDSHPMLVRKGQIKVHHFAHYPSFEGTCSDETALHKAAKLAIKEGFESARDSGSPFPLKWHCNDCGAVRFYNGINLADQVKLEVSVYLQSSLVRVDLLFSDGLGQSQFAVEVVVTRGLEEKRQKAIAELGLSVFIVEATWNSIGKLRAGIQANGTLNISSKNCINCHKLEKKIIEGEKIATVLRTESRLQRRLLDVERAQVRRWWNKGRLNQLEHKIKYWKTDRQGNQMFPNTRDQVYATAKKLLKLGFQQTTRNEPWIFMIQHPQGKIYADLGGTEEVPTYDDTSPLLYMSSESDQEVILEVVYKLLQAKGIYARFSSYHDGAYIYEEDDDENDE